MFFHNILFSALLCVYLVGVEGKKFTQLEGEQTFHHALGYYIGQDFKWQVKGYWSEVGIFGTENTV